MQLLERLVALLFPFTLDLKDLGGVVSKGEVRRGGRKGRATSMGCLPQVPQRGLGIKTATDWKLSQEPSVCELTL